MSTVVDLFADYRIKSIQVTLNDDSGIFTASAKASADGTPIIIFASGITAERALVNLYGRASDRKNWREDKQRGPHGLE